MVWLVGWIAAAQAAPVVNQGPIVVLGSGEGWTEDVVVLAVDGVHGKVAFRRIAGVRRGGDEEQPPVSCGYAGMQDRPTVGVELGVYDLAAGKTVETWWVYEPATSKAACTPQAKSEANLAAAKARFAALGLDIATPPPPLDLASVGLRQGPPSRPLPAPEDEEERMVDDLVQLSVFRGADELYHRAVRYTHHMAGTHVITFERAWRADDVVVVLECHHGSGMRWDDRSCSLLRL